jgi:predicted amidophosphoribosyltransferase
MTKRRTTRKRKPATVKVSPVAIIIDRYETRCGACMKTFEERQAKACPHCESTFTHLTTTCIAAWMKPAAQSHRPDLEWVELGDLA